MDLICIKHQPTRRVTFCQILGQSPCRGARKFLSRETTSTRAARCNNAIVAEPEQDKVNPDNKDYPTRIVNVGERRATERHPRHGFGGKPRQSSRKLHTEHDVGYQPRIPRNRAPPSTEGPRQLQERKQPNERTRNSENEAHASQTSIYRCPRRSAEPCGVHALRTGAACGTETHYTNRMFAFAEQNLLRESVDVPS